MIKRDPVIESLQIRTLVANMDIVALEMQRNRLFVWAMLLVCAAAAPLGSMATSKNKRSPKFIFRRASVNDCGDSSFYNGSTGGSPSVQDCLQIAANIGKGGTWEVEDIGNVKQLQVMKDLTLHG